MKTTLELLRERLLKDKEIFPNYNEYINGILYDIDNELLAMEKDQIKNAYNYAYTKGWNDEKSEYPSEAEQYFNKTFKSE